MSDNDIILHFLNEKISAMHNDIKDDIELIALSLKESENKYERKIETQNNRITELENFKNRFFGALYVIVALSATISSVITAIIIIIS